MAGGVELAAWCDLRVAGASARIGCLERRWGVPLIDGGTYRLPQIVGLGRALDLILTGREIGAEEAERMGFVNRVVPDGEALATAVALAGEIAAFPWLGVVNDRKSVYAGLGLGLEEALAIEDELGRQTIFADGFREGVDRFNDHQAQTRPLTRPRSRGSPVADSPGRADRSRVPPSGGPAAGAPVVALDALPGGALDVVGEEVGAAEARPCRSRAGRGTPCARRSHSSTSSISRARQKSLASPARSSLSASGVMMQQRGSRRRSWAFTALGMLPM